MATAKPPMENTSPPSGDDDSSAQFPTQETSTSPPHQRRPHRPGFNSYLKVLLDDTTITRLHQATVDMQQEAVKVNVKVKPRSQNSLHLTLLFAGEVLVDLPATELELWHARIRERLAKAGFDLVPDKKDTTSGDDDDDDDDDTDAGIVQDKTMDNNEKDDTNDPYWLQFENFEIFPPRRRNLIVARLQTSPAWQNLFHELQTLTQDGCDDWPALSQLVRQRSHGATWVAHLTLANLNGNPKGDATAALQVLLDEATVKYHGETAAPPRVVGIAMGGPVPTQVTLSWNFMRGQSVAFHDQEEATDQEL